MLDEKADGKATTPTRLQWDKSVAEVKEQAMAKLQEELRNAYDKLKLKDEEVARLSRIRQDVESELEDLTASLFLVRVILFYDTIVIISSNYNKSFYENFAGSSQHGQRCKHTTGKCGETAG